MRCPRGCEHRMNEVWGTPAQYSSRSSVCSAAIHAGKINEEQGGIVTVYKVKPVPTIENVTWMYFYESSQRGWLESTAGKFFQSSFTFDVYRIQCSKDAVGINGSFMFFCPPGCHRENYRVIGDGIYTEDTNICAAAIHDGQIPKGGGMVSGYQLPGMTSYTGSKKNGIRSNSHGEGESSFTFEIPCGMTAEKFKLNDRFTIVCPLKRDCWMERDKRAVYGKYVFSERSSLCRAAIHDRAVPYIYTGGVAHIRIVKGLPSYRGIYYAQIQSESSGPTEKAFIFENGRERFGMYVVAIEILMFR
ncbi:cysteine-rich secretory protein LCCL domain-containing 2-like [Ciona intestinalis]